MSKKYILIQNDGAIESNSFELIGASTKRGETVKIGFFGSGLKYSIAYMMRNNIDFRVFSGEQELKFTTTPETLKEQQFDRICINGKPTSYTVTMGPTWTEDWFVLREIYCNALDEGSCTMVRDIESINPSAGKTRIFIELTGKLQSVVDMWDAYFSDEREPVFVSSNTYTCYLGNEDVVATATQNIKVFTKTDGVLFRKGIRVYKKAGMLFDYGCDSININEDRTARNPSGIHYAFAEMAAMLNNEDWLKSILRTQASEKPCDEYDALTINGSDGVASPRWIEFSKENMLVVEEISGRFTDEIATTKKEVFLIPSTFAKRIKNKVPETLILGMGRKVGDTFSEEVEATPKMQYLLKEVIKALKDMNYDVPHDISVVNFEDDDTLGAANIEEKKILIAAKTFDMGRRELALVLMEETEHIISKKEDETRAFQNHIFSQWLTSMENQNGLFL